MYVLWWSKNAPVVAKMQTNTPDREVHVSKQTRYMSQLNMVTMCIGASTDIRDQEANSFILPIGLVILQHVANIAFLPVLQLNFVDHNMLFNKIIFLK